MVNPGRVEDQVLTPEELAKRWKVNYVTILSQIRSGKIPSFMINRQYRVPLSWVEGREKVEA